MPRPRVPQLLTLYDPLVHADTVRMHVEHVRKHGAVWWGRFQSGIGRALTEADVRRAWPHVAELADERAANGDASILFVTNLHDLHACKVTHFAFGDDPRAVDERGGGVRRVREGAPSYYGNRRIAMWFRVADVRALSFDLAMTLDAFRHELGSVRGGAVGSEGAPFTRSYDPYAAVHFRYPIVVDAHVANALFDRASMPSGFKRFCDSDSAVRPMRVQRAHGTLARVFAPMWPHLEPGCREALANAWVLKTHVERDDLDPAVSFTRLAIGVETELCLGLVGALEDLVARVDAASRPGQALRGVLAECRPERSVDEQRTVWTLGDARAVLGRLAKRCGRLLEVMGLGAVVSAAEAEVETKWLKELNELRNAASHARQRSEPRLRGAVEGFFKEKGRGLRGLADAKRAVRAWRSSGAV